MVITNYQSNIARGKSIYQAGKSFLESFIPKTGECIRGRMHTLAVATIGIIAKSDPFLGLSLGTAYAAGAYIWNQEATQMMDQGLKSWCEEKMGTPEYEARRKAAEKIKICYARRSTTLDLGSSNLTSLPPAIGSLTNLQSLYLNNNRLISLPPEINSLTRLQFLDLSSNELTSLPPAIGSLTNLQTLRLTFNQFSSLPPAIGSLASLQTFHLLGNPLTSLPIEIFDLTRNCTVDLTDCPFTSSVLERIRDRVSIPGYNGPRISHSINQRATETSVRPLNEVLDEMYQICKKEQPPLTTLREHKGAPDLETWLGKISWVADFKKGGEAQIELTQKVIEYLELAEKDKAFRDIFFPIIEEGATTCGDKVALSIVYLGVAKRLAKIDLNHTDKLADLMIRGVWAIDELEKIAREKIKTLPFFDEVEVYLGYLVPLREKLNLLLDVQEMLYFRCSNISKQDLDKAYDTVSKKLQSYDAQCKFLAGQDLWRKALQEKDPGAYDTAMQSDNPPQAFIELTKQIHKPSQGSASSFESDEKKEP